MPFSINYNEIAEDQAQDQAQAAGLAAGQDQAQAQGKGQGSGNFMANIDQNLQLVNNILEKINNLKNNPMVAEMIASKVKDQGGDASQIKAPGQTSGGDLGKAPDQDKNQAPDQGGQDDAEKTFKQILNGIEFAKDKFGPDMPIGQLEDLIKDNKEIVKQGIKDQMQGDSNED